MYVHGRTVSKIITPIFSFIRKRVVNTAISEPRPISNESSDSYSFYRLGVQTNFEICVFLFKKNNG